MKRYLFTEDELRLRWAEIQANREKTIKNQDGDLDQIKIDQDLNLIKDLDQIKIDQDHDLDPDGLNSEIRGKYAPLLREDILYLLARGWKCDPRTLTNATKRMGPDWVRQQIQFVNGREGVLNRGRYLSAILARNVY